MTKNSKIGILKLTAMLIAVMLTGCSGVDFVEEIELEEMPIEFSSTTQNTTRAAISNNAELATAGGFAVWGYKTKTEGLDWANNPCYTIFDNEKVYSNGNNGAYIEGAATNWTYATKKYWDLKSTYCFYAAGPASGNTAGTLTLVDGSSANDKHFEISGVSSMSSADDSKYNDFIITRQPVIRNGSNTVDNVDFDFHHVMSKVALKFKAGIDDCTITVTDVKMSGWSTQKCNFTQSLNYTAGENTTEWSLPEGKSHNKAGVAAFQTTNATMTGLNSEAATSSYWIMVPQAVQNLKFTVSYTITYSDGITDTFENVEGTLTNQNWYTDCQTTYTLTISPKPIKFNVSSVTWTGNSDATIIVQ